MVIVVHASVSPQNDSGSVFQKSSKNLSMELNGLVHLAVIP